MPWLIELISRIADKVYSLISPTRVLLEAAENGRYKVIAQLLRLPVGKRPDVNARDSSGNTPLHLAAQSGHTAVVAQLLNLPVGERPDVNARNKDRNTPLFYLRDGFLDKLLRLLGEPDAYYGDTPLHLAAQSGHTAVVAQFLKLPVGERPDVNARDNHGNTPLHLAAQSGHTAVVAQFLNLPVGQRPDVNVRNNNGHTPLYLAARNGRAAAIEQFLNLPVGERPDVNTRDNHGNTPLHRAAVNNYTTVVEQLLKLPVGQRPDVNAKNKNHDTPLHWAAQNDRSAVVAQLLKLPVGQRPDVNARSDGNMTPLHLAAKLGRTAIVTQFLNLPVGERPDVNPRDFEGKSPLYVAAKHGHTAIVAQFLNLPVGERPDVHAANNINITPIHAAFEQGHPETVALLQRYGATLPAHLGAGDAPGAAAINNAQSIHTASTHESVSESATKLLRRYREKEIDVAKKELCDWVLSQTDTDIKTLAAKAAINTYGNLNYTDPRSGVTFKQAFGLIWLGINDLNAVAGKTLTEEDLNARKKTLIEHLYRMQRGYNLNAKGEDKGGMDRSICGSGGFSTLINTLAGGHQDVTFVYITSRTISLKAGAILTECIKAITPETKNKYLKEAKEEELPKEILAVIKQEIQQKLNDEFLGCKGLPLSYATLVDGFLQNLKYHPEINKLAQELCEMQKSEVLPSVDIDDAAAEEASRSRKRARR